MNQRLVSNRKSHVVADIQDKTNTFTWPVEEVMTNIGKSLLSWLLLLYVGKLVFWVDLRPLLICALNANSETCFY